MGINIEHYQDNDLAIYLKAPNDTIIPLSTNNGGFGNHYGNPNNCPAENVNFNMNTTRLISRSNSTFIGDYRPEGNFSNFNDGSNPNGVWQLVICDNDENNTGTINYAKLEFASCGNPHGITSTKAAGDSVKIHWSPESLGGSSYEVEYGEVGFDPGSGTLIKGIQDTSVYITGISNISTYDVYVRQVCTPNDTSDWGGPYTFYPTTSGCYLDKTIPDNGCSNGDTLRFPIVVSKDFANSLGQDIVLSDVNLIIEHSQVNDIRIALKSPSGVKVPISRSNGGFGNNYGDPNNCPSVVANFNMNAPVDITSGNAPFQGSYKPEGDFSNFNDNSDPDGTWQLIICDDDQGNEGEIAFAELAFATCQPSDLQGVRANQDTVELNWKPGALSSSSYEIQYGNIGFNLGSGTTITGITDTSATVTGLSTTQGYDFYLRSLCSTGDTTGWIGPYTIYRNSTPCSLNKTIRDISCSAGDSAVIPFAITNTAGDSLGYNAAIKEVRFIIEHYQVNDIRVSLQSPKGQQIDLTRHNGGFANHYGDPTSCPYGAVTFSKDGVTRIDSASTPFTGIFRPRDSFKRLYNGGDPDGIWRLIICDNDQNNEGILKYAAVDMYNPLSCKPGPRASLSNDTTVNFGDSITLTGSGGTSYRWSTGDTTATITITPESSKRYVLTVEDPNGCTDKAQVFVKVNPRPTLTYSKMPAYKGKHGVEPQKGTFKSAFSYRVTYTHPDNIPPENGYPRVGIDYNGNGTFNDANDSRVYMTELDASDKNYKDGKVYTYTRGFGKPNKNLQYSFLAYDTLGSPAKGEATKLKDGPLVTDNDLDLYVYADDITFSDKNPDVSDTVKITADLHNNGALDASSVLVSFYREDTLIARQVVNKIPGKSVKTVSIDHSFPVDEYYPMKVVIDEFDNINENNELNNFAIRPLTVGNFTVSAGIDVTGEVAPNKPCTNENFVYKGQASYLGTLDPNTDVSGAEVKVEILETGEIFKSYTNSKGKFNVLISASTNTGSYHVKATVTDFTLVGKSKQDTFTTQNCPSNVSRVNGYTPLHWSCSGNCSASGGSSGAGTITYPALKPDIRVRSYQISPSELNPDKGENVRVFGSFKNAGGVSADSFYVMFFADSKQLGKSILVDVLAPGQQGTVESTQQFSSSQNGAHVLRVQVDTPDLVTESKEMNNLASRAIIVGNVVDFGFLEPEDLTISNPSPLNGDTTTVTAKIWNKGGRSGTGKVRFYTVKGTDTTVFDSASLTLGKLDTTTKKVQWIAKQTSGQIYAEIADVSPNDVNPRNNQAHLPLGNTPPQIVRNPTPKVLCEGTTATLTVQAKYASNYQWKKDGFDVAQPADSQLTISNVNAFDTGSYRVIVTNGAGSDTSKAVKLKVRPLAVSNFNYQLNGDTLKLTSNAKNANSLKWKFGDGNTDTSANPTHVFSSDDIYQVCLYASNSCNTDTACRTIGVGVTIPDTIKGTVAFNGDPLNEAKVSLWKKQNTSYSKTDSIKIQVSDNGEFNFGSVPSGQYLVRALVEPDTGTFRSYIPTYHKDHVFWQNADVLDAKSSGKAITADISMQTGTKDTGDGDFSGSITEAGPNKRLDEGDPIDNVAVYAMNLNEKPLDKTLSNTNGIYRFDQMALDTYRVHVEIPGLVANDRIVILDEENSSEDSVNFKVDQGRDSVYSGIQKGVSQSQIVDAYKLYPNPAESRVTLELSANQDRSYQILFKNTLGQNVLEKRRLVVQGENRFTFKLNHLSPGVYFVQLKQQDTDRLSPLKRLIIIGNP